MGSLTEAMNMVPVLVCVLLHLSHLTEAKPALVDDSDAHLQYKKQWDYGDGFMPYKTDDDDDDDVPERPTGLIKRQYDDGFMPYRKSDDDYYDDYDNKTNKPKARLFADDLKTKLKRHGKIASKTKKYFDFGDGFVPYRRQYDDGYMPYRSASEKNDS